MARSSQKYDTLISEMPAGLGHGIATVLKDHVGELHAIGRMDLVSAVSLMGFTADERQVRAAIRQLRRDGHLICSASGENGGYYIAENSAEYANFRRDEFAAKIEDMSETMTAMDTAARKRFGPGYLYVQERLI
jgi:Mrp family chromosome partitioning ATPase